MFSRYLIMFLLLPAITCYQENPSKFGLPIPPYDTAFSLFSDTMLYFIDMIVLAVALVFSLFPKAEYYKLQTCTLIAFCNIFLVSHILAILGFNNLGWILGLISLIVGASLGFLSFTTDMIRELALLPPIGYITGYFICALLGINNTIIAIGLVVVMMFASFSLKLLLSRERTVYIGRGVCVGFLAWVTLNMCIPFLNLVRTVHGVALGYIPFMPTLFCFAWLILLAAGVYYEFNRAEISAKIENRKLTDAQLAEGLGVKADEKYKDKVNPSASMV
ncbi:hypothetical protein CDIK_0668 [Cucumispora dikerogammari]|nr:hypothetical protein CDIK_0668 [Cucumispora dikerogammari]